MSEKNIKSFIDELIKEVEDELDEANVTGNVDGYDTPHAFSGKNSDKKRKKTATQFGYTLVNNDINNIDESVNEVSLQKGKTYGGSKCEGGCFIGKEGLKKIIKISKDSPNDVFMFRDDNYSGLQPHFIKDGVIARANTINPAYDLEKNKVRSLNIDKDVILSVRLFVSTNESVNEVILNEDTKRVNILGIDFNISEMNGRIFFSFIDKKAASIKIREIGTNKIVNLIQNSLDNAYGKGEFLFKGGDHAEFQNGYLFQRSIGNIKLNKLKFESINEALDPKAEKFLDAIQVNDRSIKDLKNITVDATPQGNWSVYYKGKRMFTLNGKMLDDKTIMKYGLEHMDESLSEGKKIQRPVNRWLELKNDESMHANKKLATGLRELKYQFKESVNEDAPIYKDWDEFVNPHYILVTLKNGKKLKIEKKNVKGGTNVYHAILKAFNDNNHKITNKVVSGMLDRLGESVNEDKVYIDFLNKKKGFKQDRIKFNSYEDAVKWAKKNFDKFNPDMIKYESVNEAQAKYDVYHDSYTSAIQSAKEYAEKQGYTINDDDSFRKIGMGPRKPSEGKTNSFSIELSYGGKDSRKQLHIQVYGMRNKYELNCYIG